jgi:hypothetical protein
MEALLSYVCLNHVASADSRVSPVANVSVISAAWRKVHIGCNFSQFLHSSSQVCLGWAIKVSSMMPDQHLCQYVHKLVFEYLFNDYHFPEDDNHHSHRRGNLKSYRIFILSLFT